MRCILFLVTLVFSIVSCRKDGPVYDGNCIGDCLVLQGKVVEQQTQLPLQNFKVGIYYKHPPDLFAGSRTEHIGEVTTRPDGSYSFAFPKKAYTAGTIQFRGGIPGYINKNFEEGVNTITAFKLQNVQSDTLVTELKLWRSALLKVRVKTTTITGFNTFFFNNTFHGSYFGTYSVHGNRSFDTTFNILTASDIPTYIVWRTLQGPLLQGNDTIVVPSASVGNLLIEL